MPRLSALLAIPVVFSFACSDQPTSSTEALALSPVFAHAPAAGFGWSYAFLQFGDPDDPPSAVAKNGDKINISLDADLAPFSFHPKTIDGGGDFTIRYAGGGATNGTWEATKLISFQSYGSTDFGEGGVLFGGSLQLHITLSHEDGRVQKGILRLTCTDFGNPPPGAKQGIVLKVVGGERFTGSWAFDADDNPVGPIQGATFFVENEAP